MTNSLVQGEILKKIIDARCGSIEALNVVNKETEEYLNSIIGNYKIPEGVTAEQLVYETLLRVFYDLHTYNPTLITYEDWLKNILKFYITGCGNITDIYGSNLNDVTTNRIYWNVAYKDRMPISNIDPFDSVYIREIRHLFLNYIRKIKEEKHRQALLLTFQNPPKMEFWAEKLHENVSEFRDYFFLGMKNLKELIFNEDKKKHNFISVMRFITGILHSSPYLTQREINHLSDDKMKLSLMYALSYRTSAEAAAETQIQEDEYLKIFTNAVFELADIFTSKAKPENPDKEISEKGKDSYYIEMDMAEKVLDYRNSLMSYGLKQVSSQLPFAIDEELRKYTDTTDFMYLLFTEQFNPSAPTITELLEFAVNSDASDLHLSSGLEPILRIDGDMCRIVVPPLDNKVAFKMVDDVMNENQRIHYRKNLEADFSIELPGKARFRVNAYNQNRGPGAAFRTIPKDIMSLEDINAPALFKDIVDVQSGLVLVTGPTGSGKSTTLAALIEYKNNKDFLHIITIEDPIEFVYTSNKCLINQRELHRDTLGFNEALRSALREDPDIILVGELRDLETIRLALTAAETGHLVLATLHTNSAPKTIDRIIDVFPPNEKLMMRFMLAESLQAVITQSLIKKTEGGRCAVWEIMLANSAIRSLIREDKIHQMKTAMLMSQSEGMQTLDQHLKQLIKDGIVNPIDAKGKAQDKTQFLV